MGTYKHIGEQTKKNLLDAFWQLYCYKKIEKISVKEITDKAGYNRSTFYEYFRDVYDCLEHIENSLIPSISDLPPIYSKNNNSKSSLDAFVQMYLQSSEYYTVLLGENGDPAFTGKIKKEIKAIIKENIVVTNINSLELDYSLEFILSAMIGTLTYWFSNNENISQDRLINLINSLMENPIINQITNSIL